MSPFFSFRYQKFKVRINHFKHNDFDFRTKPVGLETGGQRISLGWVEEIRGRMSQKLQGYNQKLIAFGSSMSETLEELTNTLGKYFIYNTLD